MLSVFYALNYSNKHLAFLQSYSASPKDREQRPSGAEADEKETETVRATRYVQMTVNVNFWNISVH